MSTLQWILIGTGSVFLIFVLCMVYLRVKKPHSGKMASEQAKVDKKVKMTSKPSDRAEESNGGKGFEWFKGLSLGSKIFWNTVIAVGTIVMIVFWGSETQINSIDVGTWSRDHWFQVLIAWGLAYLLIWLNANEKTAKTLQRGLVVVMIASLFVYPIWADWVKSFDHAQASSPRVGVSSRVLAQNTANLPRVWNVDGSRTDPSTWPILEVPPYGDSIHVPLAFGHHLVWGGSGYEIRYVYSDGHECIDGDASRPCVDGNIVAGYARNPGGTLLLASYAYEKQGEK